MEIKLKGWNSPVERLILWALGLLPSCESRGFPLLFPKFQGWGDGASERKATVREKLQNPESRHHMLYSLENYRSSQLWIFPEEVYECSFSASQPLWHVPRI